MSNWTYLGKPIDELDLSSFIGFVYIIERIDTGRKYVGKKLLTSRKTRAPLKGQKRKRVSQVKSDYETYFGSNEELKAEVAALGAENFRRTVLHFCKGKGEMSYLEMKEQILRDVLLKPSEYYNGYVGGRIARSHVKNLTVDTSS